MGKYVLLYSGGSGMAMTPAEQAAIMQDWMSWFGQLGPALADGGSPFGPASTTIAPNGSTSNGGGVVSTGYSVLNADSEVAAVALAKGCPVLKSGGSITVYAAMAM
ncbi:MAG TPA: hypothetical protein VGK87_06090 [Anaerolineae bacterium]